MILTKNLNLLYVQPSFFTIALVPAVFAVSDALLVSTLKSAFCKIKIVKLSKYNELPINQKSISILIN